MTVHGSASGEALLPLCTSLGPRRLRRHVSPGRSLLCAPVRSALQPGSLCIDAGDDAVVSPDWTDLDSDGDTAELLPFDLLEQSRRVGPVDMGAFEAQGAD